jgi:hypothetical protein
MSSETEAVPRTWGVSACRRTLPPRISYRMSFDQSVPAARVTMVICTGKPVGNNADFAAKLILVPADGRSTSCWA